MSSRRHRHTVCGVLIGREREREKLERLVQQAQAGHGGAVVVRGEAGVGKSALLAGAADRAETTGARVLRARGVESETQLPFAALHQLLHPLAELVVSLPEPQATALNAALAVSPAEGVDRFSVFAGTVSLLSTAAVDQPLVCVLDDAHWLDEASTGAVAFVARRLSHEPVAMLIATRTEATAFAAEGLDILDLPPLTADEARALLAAERPTLLPAAADAIVRSSEGNPLALLEFSAAVEGGIVSLGRPLPIREAVQRTFGRRAERLSRSGRRALLLAAAGEGSGAEAIWSALELEAIGAKAVAEAQREHLLLPGRDLQFCHPLARSAVYHAAPPSELRGAHETLARATKDPIARAWHLAEAVAEPDPAVAEALELAAGEARRRGGTAVEASALERSATLTLNAELRARRLFAAGLAAEAAGEGERAETMLAEVSELTTDQELRGQAVARWSYLLFDRGEFDRALRLATEAADAASPAAAAQVLTGSGVVHALMHRLAIPDARAVAERAARLAGETHHDQLDVCHMLAWTWEVSGISREALALAKECLPRVELGSVIAIDVAAHFIYLEDYVTGREVLERIVSHLRRSSAFGNLAYALDHLSNLDLRTGRTVAAYSHSVEAVELMDSLAIDVGVAASLARLALIEAVLGKSDEARVHGARALDVAVGAGDHWNEVRARAALGLEALSRGDFDAAASVLERAVRMADDGGVHHPNLFRVHGDLVESLVRTGRPEEAEDHLRRFERDVELTCSPWGRAVVARCRALLSDHATCESVFATAVRASEAADGYERGRTLLALGQRLRRLRRVRDARQPLHLALESFEHVGARHWADRTRAELRATGERLRPRGRLAHEDLTPQELQVALAAADGLTNKEIAARLFLSPKTVEFHLTRAYRKIGVRSRAELAGILRTPRLPDDLSA